MMKPQLLAIVLACASCSDQEFQVRHSAGLPRGGEVSVLGIFKDGRLDTAAWEDVALRLLRKERCLAGFTRGLAEARPGVHGSVDRYVRDNGVTEKLLDLLAPAARSDRIMVLTVAGGPPKVFSRKWVPEARARGGSRSSRGGHFSTVTDGRELTVSAEVFSVKEHRFVEQVRMSYGGQDTEGALTRFADKLAAEIPIAACAAWDWAARLDEEKITKLETEE
jgi:hypothetical protein